MPRVLAILRLKPGSHEAVRALLNDGSPFDPEGIAGLERHEVFLTSDEVVFLFLSQGGPDVLASLLASPDLWDALGPWREYIEAAPRLADEAFSWVRAEEDADVFYLGTPGPGDSDGGDIF